MGTKVRFFLESINVGQDDNGQITTAPVCVPILDIELTGATADEHRGAARKPLPAAQEIALRLLEKAIVEAGEELAAFGHIPANTRVISVGTWRSYCDDRGLTHAESAEAKRKAFNRARTELLKRGLIEQWQQWVWVAPRNKPGLSRDMSQLVPGPKAGHMGVSLEPMSQVSWPSRWMPIGHQRN